MKTAYMGATVSMQPGLLNVLVIASIAGLVLAVLLLALCLLWTPMRPPRRPPGGSRPERPGPQGPGGLTAEPAFIAWSPDSWQPVYLYAAESQRHVTLAA